MKTTIDFPDEVLREAKVYAAQNRMTLREIVIAGVQAVTGESQKRELERRSQIDELLKDLSFENQESVSSFNREDCYDR